MVFRITRAIAACVAAVLLGAWSCGSSGSAPNSDSPTTSTRQSISYEAFLAVLAENNWVPSPDQAFIGGVDKGVEVTVMNCRIRVVLVQPNATDFRVNSVNGYDPGYFGDESEKLLGPTNITRSVFQANLKQLTDKGDIPPC